MHMTDPLGDTQPVSRRPQGSDQTHQSSATQARAERDIQEHDTQPIKTTRKRPSSFSVWMRLALLVLLGVLGVGSVSAPAGWSVGRQEFGATATIETGLYLFEQYNLALADIEAGNYELARQRLEFIFVEEPEFLDVADKWVEVMLVLGQTSVPTDSQLPTPSATPTEDPRPKEELLLVARGHIQAREWTQAIDTLLALRKADASYLSAEVDGMLYLALRNRGVQNILELGLFEPGLYDFALMENFGPLDGQAENYQEWARLYLYGNAFWLAYPQEAAYYYGQLVNLAPDLRDSDGLSAFYRYWQSLIHYADQTVKDGDWCVSSEAYENALAAGRNGELQVTADYAYEQCIAKTPSATPTVTITNTATIASILPSATLGSATATFTSTATATSGGGPTNTPTNTSAVVPTKTFTPTPGPTNTSAVAPTNTFTPTSTPTATATTP